MSHYSLTVVLPPGQYHLDTNDDTDRAALTSSPDLRAVLDQVLRPYDENEQDAPGAIAPKWDWWAIGGRWRGSFKVKVYSEAEQVTTDGTHPRWDRPFQVGHVDGGLKGTLDLAAMRAEATEDAAQKWDEYQRVIAGTPEPLPWSHFVDRVEAAESAALGRPRREALDAIRDQLRLKHDLPLGDAYWDANWDDKEFQARHAAYEPEENAAIEAALAKLADTYGIEQARRDYAEQPRVQVVREHESYRELFFSDPIEEIGGFTREDYIERARLHAVPGFAVLLVGGNPTDGFTTQWIAKGEMGWFGMSTENRDSEDYYLTHVNKLIDELADDAVLVTVDLHI